MSHQQSSSAASQTSEPGAEVPADEAEDVATMDGGQDEEQGDEEEQVSGELLARVRELTELQRQLEGLEQVTASLQTAVSRADRSGGPPAARAGAREPGGGRPRGMLGFGRRRARAEGAEEEEEPEVHPHVTCDGCRAGPPLVGPVMHCADCADFDLCARCYRGRERLNHPRGHRFQARAARAPGERHGPPSHFLLQMLESAMLSEALRRSAEGEAGGVGEEAARKEDEAARRAARGAEVLAHLKREAWSPALKGADGSQGGECALCLEEYDLAEEVLTLPCTHFFHEACVKPWFAKSLLCPLCQQEASSASDGAAAAP